MKRLAIVLIGFVFSVLSVWGTNLTVTNILVKQDIAGNKGVASVDLYADTPKESALPLDIATPIFWLDGSATNDWQFEEEGGRLYAVNVPSRLGTRYLSTDANGGSWSTWANHWTLKKPIWVAQSVSSTDNANCARGFLDFGPMGSDCGLLFDPIPCEGGVATNALENIGTVIMVFDATQGGGYLMGGGFAWNMVETEKDPLGWLNEGALWLRPSATGCNSASKYASVAPWNFVTRGSAHYDFQHATYRRNSGVMQSPLEIGFGNGWEIVSVVCASNRLQATGIGLGDARHIAITCADGSHVYLNGGQRIAEMLVYDKCLTAGECTRIESYLRGKWFAPKNGENGRAVLNTLYGYRSDWQGQGFPIDVNVPAGETLVLARNQHGRGGIWSGDVNSITNLSAFIKKGAGTFELRDAANFQGVVRLQEGRLTVPQRAVPTALPDGAVLHFDASQLASLVTSCEADHEYVCVWRNLGLLLDCDEAIVARSETESQRPWLLRDALGTGLHVVDFGPYRSAYADGRYLTLATNEVTSTFKARAVAHCLTVVMMIGAQENGGYALGDDDDCYFRRGAEPTSYRTDVFAHGSADYAAFINGVGLDKGGGFHTPGYQAYAMRQVHGNGTLVKRIGSALKHAGGCRLAEIAVYRRALTDTEMLDAQAYLMRKWLNRTAPGYCYPASFKAPMVQNLRIEGDAEVYVPAGETLVVGTISGNNPLIKTGGGCLKYQKNELVSGASIVPREGIVQPVLASDPASKLELAAAPSLHLDPTNLKTLDLLDDEVEGKSYVKVFDDVSRGNAAFVPLASVTNWSPWRVKTGGPNNQPYLDFGPLTHAAGGRSLYLAQPLNSVRSVFMICRFEGKNAMPLGSVSESYGVTDTITKGVLCDFLRQSDNFVGSNPGAACAYRGSVYTNGVLAFVSDIPVHEQWMLVELHTKGGSHVSAIGLDRSIGSSAGGFKLGEMLLYERVLSDREKTATRNYLLNKWFGKAENELADLPTLDEENISSLTGTGTFTLDEANKTQAFYDWSGFTGTVSLVAGKLSILKGTPDGTTGTCATNGLIYHADATYGLTLVTNEPTIHVAQWESALKDGWVAKPAIANNPPTITTAQALNRHGIVDMGKSGDNEALVFYKDGVRAHLGGIRSILWVLDSKNGGGFLMGGGTNATNAAGHYNFHRGNNGGSQASDVILNQWHSQAEVAAADWRLNGTAVKSGSTGLSGSWDIISMNLKANATNPTEAEGFAFDGRFLDDSSTYRDRLGRQNLAEVLIYNRRLSDAEIVETENYLRNKWQVRQQAAVASGVDLEVGQNGIFDGNGMTQCVASVTGAGILTNGTFCAQRLIVDATSSAAEVPVVRGTWYWRTDTVLQLNNLKALGKLRGKRVPIMNTDSLVTENGNFEDIPVTGEDLPRDCRVSLRLAKGVVYAVFHVSGFAIIMQ